MLDKMKQIYDMQKKAKELKQQLENARVEISREGGKIQVTANGAMRIERIAIDAALLSSDQKTQLETALVSALNEALAQAQQNGAAQAASLMKGFGL